MPFGKRTSQTVVADGHVPDAEAVTDTVLGGSVLKGGGGWEAGSEARV